MVKLYPLPQSSYTSYSGFKSRSNKLRESGAKLSNVKMSHTNIRIEPVRLKIINKVGRPGSKVYFWRIGFSSAARRDRVSHHFCKNKPTSLFTRCRLDVLSRSDEMFYESKFYCLYLQLQSDIDMPKIH